jgi:hypothetical protein
MDDFEFGSDFTGTHNMWVLRFASERVGSITVNTLVRDIDGLPVYDDLDETATFDIVPARINVRSLVHV